MSPTTLVKAALDNDGKEKGRLERVPPLFRILQV